MPTDPYILSIFIIVAGLIAGVLPLFFTWSHFRAHQWISVGAGMILGAAFLHMIPEAFEMVGARSFPAMLLGFLTLYLIEQLALDHHPHDENDGTFYELGILTFIGILLHDLIDGVALGSGHHVPEVTPAIFTALILHKIPTTFSLSLLMLHGGYRKSRILLFVGAALLMIPVGVLLAEVLIPLVGATPQAAVGRLILFSAGTFIYISVYELLPEMHRQSDADARIGRYFLLGLGVMLALEAIHPVA